MCEVVISKVEGEGWGRGVFLRRPNATPKEGDWEYGLGGRGLISFQLIYQENEIPLC